MCSSDPCRGGGGERVITSHGFEKRERVRGWVQGSCPFGHAQVRGWDEGKGRERGFQAWEEALTAKWGVHSSPARHRVQDLKFKGLRIRVQVLESKGSGVGA